MKNFDGKQQPLVAQFIRLNKKDKQKKISD